MKNRLYLPCRAVLLAACSAAFDQQSDLDGAIERYHEAHASERGGQCLAPHIDGITRTEVVEDDLARLVVDVRCLHRKPPVTCAGCDARVPVSSAEGSYPASASGSVRSRRAAGSITSRRSW
jgi:hypothetical protein